MAVAGLCSEVYSVGNLSGGLKENIKAIENTPFKVTSFREYPEPNLRNWVTSKYICKYKEWEITIKEYLQPDDVGVLILEGIECLTTGENYNAFCDIRGGIRDIRRLERIIKIMDEGYNTHLKQRNEIFNELKGILYEQGLLVVGQISESDFLESGYLDISDGNYKLYLSYDEDELGEVHIKVSNNKNWSSHSQSTNKIRGELFSVDDLDIFNVSGFIIDLFTDLNNNVDFGLPMDLYKKGYNWQSNLEGI